MNLMHLSIWGRSIQRGLSRGSRLMVIPLSDSMSSWGVCHRLELYLGQPWRIGLFAPKLLLSDLSSARMGIGNDLVVGITRFIVLNLEFS